MDDRGVNAKIYKCVRPVLRGLYGGGDFVFTELSHCECCERLVRTVDTTRGVLMLNALVQICASERQEYIVQLFGVNCHCPRNSESGPLCGPPTVSLHQ